MIAVVGEALIDLVVDDAGSVAARPGGGPFNVARTLGRLGMPTTFLGRLSRDNFGRMLRTSLRGDGVALGVTAPAEAPTTLAVADIGADGGARYEFHLEDTAAADLDYTRLSAAMPDNLTAFHVGSLALVMEPIACSVERLLADLPPDALVMVDPNCRPAAITDKDAYLDRFEGMMHRADAVKVSVEDLHYLCPGVPAEVAATTLLGEKLALVLVTDGPRPVRAFLPVGELSVPVPEVPVVDTIGAGDAFGGAFLAWWSAHGLGRDDLRLPGAVRDALRAAAAVASMTCTRAGAEPPWLAEVRALSPSW
ncbi:MAG TPA: carbohydrate kinase [Trebonia sp.]|nr:carbohydrate kinase [Trebonia sp.]